MLVAVGTWSVGVNRIHDQVSRPRQKGQHEFGQAVGTQIVNPIDHDQTIDRPFLGNDSIDAVDVAVNPEAAAEVQKSRRPNDPIVGVDPVAVDSFDSTYDVAQSAANLDRDQWLQCIGQIDDQRFVRPAGVWRAGVPRIEPEYQTQRTQAEPINTAAQPAPYSGPTGTRIADRQQRRNSTDTRDPGEMAAKDKPAIGP